MYACMHVCMYVCEQITSRGYVHNNGYMLCVVVLTYAMQDGLKVARSQL